MQVDIFDRLGSVAILFADPLDVNHAGMTLNGSDAHCSLSLTVTWQ